MHSAMHTKDKDAEPKVAGEPRGTKSTVLETGAAMTQACRRDISREFTEKQIHG